MSEDTKKNEGPDFDDWLQLIAGYLMLIPMMLIALVALVIGGLIFFWVTQYIFTGR